MAKFPFALWFSLGLGIAASAGITGCSKFSEIIRSKTGRAVVCGAGGAATGAIFYYGCNALTGKKEACIAGSVASALADGFYCWWLLSEKIVDDYEDTKKTLHFEAGEGYRLEILEFSATPKIVQPGGEVRIRMKYALMSNYLAEEIKFEQKIVVPGEKKPRVEIRTRQPGTWSTDDDYVIKIDPGQPDQKVEMSLEMKLLDQGKQARRTLCFTVSRQSPPETAFRCAAETGTGPDHAGGTFVVSKVKRDAQVRAAPKNGSKALERVRRGEKFPIVDRHVRGSKIWYKIQLEDGREGWLPASAGSLEE